MNKKLSITIHDAQFAKDFQYCISAQINNQKKPTDISAIARNPIFTNNTLIFNIQSNHTIKNTVIFLVSIIHQEDQSQHSKKDQRTKNKILGECTLDLTPFGLQPTENYNIPIRQQIKFIRLKQGRQISVGRCIVSIKIISQDQVPIYLQQLEEKKIENRQIYIDLPDYDQDMSFKWRLKVQSRSARNVPSNNGVLPQVSIELGWTQYKGTLPQEKRIYRTHILNSNNPEWNQTILITNPPHMQIIKGFIMLIMKDNNNLEDLIRMDIPLESMSPFVPYNLKIIEGKNTATPLQFYVSIILQAAENSRQKLFDIIVADIVFQPLVTPFKNMNLVMVTNTDYEPTIEFYPFSPKQDSIERIFEFDQARQFTYIMSQLMRVPPIKSSKQYKAATILTVPESFFRRQIYLYIVGQIDKDYKVFGSTDPIQKDLICLLIQKTKKKLFLSLKSHSDVKMGKCQIQLTDKEQIKINQSRAPSRRGQQTASQKIMKDLNISSNQSFFKHLTQNNQIISRILRQLDDKSQSLRQSASEIIDLRSKVKLLQNQNSILRRKALTDQDELVNLVQREIETMSQRDLKDKIIKLSQLYKSERIKSKQLDKALKIMQPQVSNTMQLSSMISTQKNTIQILQDKLEKSKKQMDRISIYKDTIKKQQKVIEKLQRVMKEGMEEVRKAKQYKLELEQLKKRGGNHNNYQYQNRDQVERLQKIIAELQSSKQMNISNVSNNNSYELEFKLHQAETRIQYLEEEIQQKAKSYARQLAMMKMKLAQKSAILDGYSQ